jgi:proteasome lid subunit RPN8/RPN11
MPTFPSEGLGWTPTPPAGERRIRIAPPAVAEARRSQVPFLQRHWLSPFDAEETRWSVRVYMTQPAYLAVCEHAASDLENEVGGALIGRWRRDARDDAPFIVVEAILPARHTRHGSAFLTFTQQSLLSLHADQESLYPRKQMVGWFHTHPRMGVFLSEYDVWLAQHFFPEPWQASLVIEPYSCAGGFFVRDGEGRLPSYRYTGFTEILAPDGRSRMQWKNLAAERLEIGFTGG